MTGREEPTTPTVATRRAILLGVGAIGAGGVLAGVLAACGSSSPSTTGGATVTKQPIKVADIPVGGGAIFADQDVVVTQPVAGQFKAFSATCTHQACLVASVAQGKIICPCHGSEYNITDGSVVLGPATRALPSMTATVTGDTITVS